MFRYMLYDGSEIREWYFVSNKVGMSHENTKTLDKIFHKNQNVTLQRSLLYVCPIDMVWFSLKPQVVQSPLRCGVLFSIGLATGIYVDIYQLAYFFLILVFTNLLMNKSKTTYHFFIWTWLSKIKILSHQNWVVFSV